MSIFVSDTPYSASHLSKKRQGGEETGGRDHLRLTEGSRIALLLAQQFL